VLTFPDAPYLPRDPDGVREARRLRAAGLLRTVLGRPDEVLAGSHLVPAPALRAAAVAALAGAALTGGAAVGFRTAAWVHIGGAEPPVLEVASPLGSHRAVRGGVRLRQVALPAGDVERVAGVPVTTPPRTAADLARDLPAAEALPWLDRLRDGAGVTPAAVVRQLDAMPAARRVTTARRLVRAWAVG
jgi:hypothetical protein